MRCLERGSQEGLVLIPGHKSVQTGWILDEGGRGTDEGFQGALDARFHSLDDEFSCLFDCSELSDHDVQIPDRCRRWWWWGLGIGRVRVSVCRRRGDPFIEERVFSYGGGEVNAVRRRRMRRIPSSGRKGDCYLVLRG